MAGKREKPEDIVTKLRRIEVRQGQGMKVPQKQENKGRLWFDDGFCMRLRPERPNHVWAYDFV